jgi:isoquinoline 1-oxidoreductase subunit beta
MGRIGKIARRTFLIGSVAVAGGVAFGVYAYRKPSENPLLKHLGDDESALTHYIRIDRDGVTIITPRADSGQGVYSVLAALVAEELDVAWQDIKVDHGPPSNAYYNGVVLAEGMPFAATDMGLLAKGARGMSDVIGKFLGLQITGGSSSVADGFVKMRSAGAAARQVLLMAASQKSGVPVADLRTRDGAVLLPDSTSFSYIELAPLAAEIEPPRDVALKDRSDWRYLGQNMQRLDVVAKSTGTQVYGIDIDLPGMVYATVRTNPRLGGGSVGYDASAAKLSPGVAQIVPVTGGFGVIADNTWNAFRAADLVEADWGDEAPYPLTSEAMWNRVGASFIEDYQDSQFKDEGDVEAAFAAGDVIEAEYRVPHLAHAPLEPLSAVALMREETLDVWVATQIPTFLLAALAKLTGLDAGNITIHAQVAGGSFGRRLEDDFVKQAVEVAMAVTGTPVKMTWSREEDMSHGFPRPMAMSRARGTVKDGRINALDLGLASASVTASQMGRVGLPVAGPDIAIVAGAWDQPFAIPHYRVTGYRVPEMVPVSSWRSVGASGNGFMHECFFDELIQAAGADPLEERLRLCNHDLSRKVLEAVGEMSSWGTPLAAGRGRGLAFTLSFGVPVAEVVEVSDTAAGIRIDKVWVAAEVGQILDPVNFENQLAGGVIWGLAHAVNCELTYQDGRPEQANFYDYEGLRFEQSPEVTVRGLENGDQIRGIGEPGVPPAGPALANAIFAATGKRIRELPLARHIEFA